MYRDKVILITGDSRGIGEALRNYFLEEKAIVYGCSRSTVKLDTPGYHHFTIDITSEPDVIKMIKTISNAHGQIDILINNAGIASMNHSLLTPGKTVEKILATNFTAVFNLCRESAKIMKKNKAGRIINLVSIAVPLLIEGEAAYAASKSALLTFSQIFAKEIAAFGITCNCIGPGPVKTALLEGVSQAKVQKTLAAQAIQAHTTYEDIINAVNFFASPNSNMVTGQVIYLGG